MLYKSILSDFNMELENILNSDQMLLQQANLGRDLCIKTLNFLRKAIEKNGFGTWEEEISFFKNYKIEPMKYLIYFTKVRSTEIQMPRISKSQQQKFLERQIKRSNAFFGQYIDFILYVEQGLTYLDRHYFTREHVNKGFPFQNEPYFKDPLFNTSHDDILAKIKSTGLFLNYLKTKLDHLQNGDKGNSQRIEWTGPYAAFIEMIYGCQAMGYFNHGNITTRKLIEEFSEFLHIKNGNHSRSYNELKARKGSRIRFFEEAGQRLLDKMDREDGIGY